MRVSWRFSRRVFRIFVSDHTAAAIIPVSSIIPISLIVPTLMSGWQVDSAVWLLQLRVFSCSLLSFCSFSFLFVFVFVVLGSPLLCRVFLVPPCSFPAGRHVGGRNVRADLAPFRGPPWRVQPRFASLILWNFVTEWNLTWGEFFSDWSYRSQTIPRLNHTATKSYRCHWEWSYLSWRRLRHCIWCIFLSFAWQRPAAALAAWADSTGHCGALWDLSYVFRRGLPVGFPIYQQ